jgi:hypothetical protein
MLLHKYYKFLSLPFPFFDKEQIELDVNGKFNRFKNKHWNKLNFYFNKKSIDFFNKFNYNLVNAELFYTPPYGQLPWHIDMYPPRDNIKINFIWGSDNHKMEWGEIKNLHEITGIKKTEVGTDYIGFKTSDIKTIDSVKINFAAIVNVGIPHRIINYSNKPRWCFCAILENNYIRVLFDQALTDLKEYIIDDY